MVQSTSFYFSCVGNYVASVAHAVARRLYSPVYSPRSLSTRIKHCSRAEILLLQFLLVHFGLTAFTILAS